MKGYLLYFSFWISLNMFSRYSHLSANFKMSLSFRLRSNSLVNVSFFSQGPFRLTMTNNAAMNTVEHMYQWYDWTSFGYICKSDIAGSRGRLFPNFLRNHHTDFQDERTSLHCHQEWKSVLFTPNSLHHKLASMFLILAILTGVRWNQSCFDFHFFLAKDIDLFL